MARTSALVVLLGGFVLAGCAPSTTPEEQRAAFCKTLRSVNAGGVDTAELTELQGHAVVLKTLLDAAPVAIEDDMEHFHSVFESWAGAVDGEHAMIDTFEELTDPSLAGAEGRIGDYIAESCGVRLGDGRYNEQDIEEARHLRKRIQDKVKEAGLWAPPCSACSRPSSGSPRRISPC